MTLYLDDYGVPSHTINHGQEVPVPSAGAARFLNQEQLDAMYGEVNDTDSPVRGMTAGEVERLAECSRARGGVDVWRDWEGCLTVWVPDDGARASLGIECVLSISTNGQIAHYDRNAPEYFPNLMMLKDNLR